jgi:hypothetical protein
MVNEQLVNRALAEIRKGYAQYQYFFAHLDSPEWLGPLSDHGLFRDPPLPSPDGLDPASSGDGVEDCRRNSRDEEQSGLRRHCRYRASLSARRCREMLPQLAVGMQLPIKLVLQDRIGDLIRHLAGRRTGRGRARARPYGPCSCTLSASRTTRRRIGFAQSRTSAPVPGLALCADRRKGGPCPGAVGRHRSRQDVCQSSR